MRTVPSVPKTLVAQVWRKEITYECTTGKTRIPVKEGCARRSQLPLQVRRCVYSFCLVSVEGWVWGVHPSEAKSNVLAYFSSMVFDDWSLCDDVSLASFWMFEFSTCWYNRVSFSLAPEIFNFSVNWLFQVGAIVSRSKRRDQAGLVPYLFTVSVL